MTRHKLTICAAGLEMVTNPAEIVANANSSYVMSVYGNCVGSTGFRLWDTAIIPSSSTGTLTSGSILTLPISANHLPLDLFDAIAVVTVNNQTLPVGVSNSPDNQGVYSTSQAAIDKIVFWTDLLRVDGTASSVTHANYRYFCDAYIPSSYSPKIYFSSPTLTSTTFNVSIQFVDQSFNPNSPPPMVFNVVAPSGSSSIPLLPNVQFGSLPTLTDLAGHWKLSISTTDTSYRSLLPFYHWGGFASF